MTFGPGPAVVVLLMATTLFAGCVGNEGTVSPDAQEGAANAVATSRTGSITGQVITVDLEVLAGVEMAS